MIPVSHVLWVSALLFTMGLLGVLIRRNLLLMLLSIELMLSAANLTFVAGSFQHGETHGQLHAFFVMAVAAAEVTIGLAMVVLLFKHFSTVDTQSAESLRE